jgi:hypothetical protein
MFPLVLGTVVGLSFGYAAIPAVVIGSLLASHTLLGLTAVSRHGLGNLEPVTVAVGATVMSDTLSLVVFAVCVSIYTTGFSPTGVALLLAQIIGYIMLVLFGLSRVGAYVLKNVENEEDAYFVVAEHHDNSGRARGGDPIAGHRRRFSGWPRGKRVSTRCASKCETSISGKITAYSNFLCGYRVSG